MPLMKIPLREDERRIRMGTNGLKKIEYERGDVLLLRKLTEPQHPSSGMGVTLRHRSLPYFISVGCVVALALARHFRSLWKHATLAKSFRVDQRTGKASAVATKVCRVTKRHYRDILELARHTYNGEDYIHEAFDKWTDSSGKNYFVGIEGEHGEIVACENLAALDQGKTAWMEGLRVHPDYRGKGLASQLEGHLVRYAEGTGKGVEHGGSGGVSKDSLPSVRSPRFQRIRLTTTMRNVASCYLAEKFGLKPVNSWAYHFLDRTGVREALQNFTRIMSKLKQEQQEEQSLEKVAATNDHPALSYSVAEADVTSFGKITQDSTLLLDWKVAEAGPEFERTFVEDRKGGRLRFFVATADVASNLRESPHQLLGYSVGRTRPSISTHEEHQGSSIRCATICMKSTHAAATLKLIQNELKIALEHGANTTMINLNEMATKSVVRLGAFPIKDRDRVVLYEKALGCVENHS